MSGAAVPCAKPEGSRLRRECPGPGAARVATATARTVSSTPTRSRSAPRIRFPAERDARSTLHGPCLAKRSASIALAGELQLECSRRGTRVLSIKHSTPREPPFVFWLWTLRAQPAAAGERDGRPRLRLRDLRLERLRLPRREPRLAADRQVPRRRPRARGGSRVSHSRVP